MRYSICFVLATSLALFAGCQSSAPQPQPQSQGLCGGIAGLPCSDGYTCIDDPSDDCDPNNGGADCGGVCVIDDSPTHCGGLIPGPGNACPEGQQCVDDPSDDCTAGIAADCPGICQTPQFCGGIANLPCPEGQQCVDDPNGCGANGGADCGGVCQPIPIEEECTCDEDCDSGQTCKDGACVDDSSGCIDEPSTDSPECGGFAGVQCEAGELCVDDPNDCCDPANGGADCAGICIPDPCYEHTDECSCEADTENHCGVAQCPEEGDCSFVCQGQ